MRKNFRKIPQGIRLKLGRLHGREIVAGCAISITREQIQSGEFSHLGFSLDSSGFRLQETLLPNPARGKYSDRNVNGEVVVRKDLPKQRFTRYADVPNWRGHGTHEVEIPYYGYQRDFVAPKEAKLVLHCANPEPNLDRYIIAVRVDEVLDRTASDFDANLLYGINILQENIGACGVEAADSSLSTYANSLRVSWDILPPGNLEEVLNRLFSRRRASPEERDQATARYEFFISLNPQNIIIGTSGFSRYFGAKITDNLVVFENVKYGNAVYILFENWEELSRKSRTELLSGRFGDNFERVLHTDGWKGRVRQIVADRR